MKTIRVKFVDFWQTFDEKDNFIVRMLQKYYRIEYSDEPDYLFFSTFGDTYIDYDCIRIFYTGENLCPDFNMCDYAIGFEYMEYQDRYIRFPLYYDDSRMGNVILAREKHKISKQDIQQRQGFCSFVYSNDRATAERKNLLDALNAYKQVDSGGKYCNNVGGPVADKLAFERQHKFSIACENSSHIGYSTEKIIDSFAAGTIPIYWGDPWIAKQFDENAFVNCHAYEDMEAVVRRVKEIDESPELYEKMLRTPAFLRESTPEEKREQLETFLVHIIDQPLEQAFRRNRYFWGRMYETRYKDYKRESGQYWALMKRPVYRLKYRIKSFLHIE